MIAIENNLDILIELKFVEIKSFLFHCHRFVINNLSAFPTNQFEYQSFVLSIAIILESVIRIMWEPFDRIVTKFQNKQTQNDEPGILCYKIVIGHSVYLQSSRV